MVDMKLEVDFIPVTNVDRATRFYESLGWRKDETPPGIIQFTRLDPGVLCSLARISLRPRRVPGRDT